MDVRVHADAVTVGRALIAALLFVGKRAASFSEAKFDDSVFRSVLRRRWTHWTFCNRHFGVYSTRKRLGVRLRASHTLSQNCSVFATKGDVTPVGEKFCEILPQLNGTRSRVASVKVKIDPSLRTLLRSNTFVARLRFRSVWIHSLGS